MDEERRDNPGAGWAITGASFSAGLSDWLRMPRIAIPAYIVHTGPGAEDYEILCDFSKFWSGAGSGYFKRPKLELWAGREDFSRRAFGARFRVSFLDQFEEEKARFRAEHQALLDQQRRRARWWSLGMVGDLLSIGVLIGGITMSTVLLALALPLGLGRLRSVLVTAQDAARRALGGERDRAEEMDGKLEGLKGDIDEALGGLDVALHPDLYAHAHGFGNAMTSMRGMKREAWPLPEMVTRRLAHRLG